jgi:hypothetical protein
MQETLSAAETVCAVESAVYSGSVTLAGCNS